MRNLYLRGQGCAHLKSQRQDLLLQASNSGKQHYLRAAFSKAGCYALSVAVTDPVTAEAVLIPPHSASERLIILPGTLAAERTQICDMPSTLVAGVLADNHPAYSTSYDQNRCETQVLKTVCTSFNVTSQGTRLDGAMFAAGASKDIIVTPYDSFGNPGASGGRFAAELVLEDDESAPSIPCQVTESTTGRALLPWLDLEEVHLLPGTQGKPRAQVSAG